MNENSLFAMLLRSPWWISIALAGGMFALVRAFLPAGIAPYAIFTALPFIVIGCVAGWRQLRAPSTARIAADLDKLRGLSWEAFLAALENAYRRDGYEVAHLSGAADLSLEKAGRVVLVACKRWKATRTGVEPLRELDTLRQKREARECVYVAAGEITDTAQAFATSTGIRLLQGPELSALLAK